MQVYKKIAFNISSNKYSVGSRVSLSIFAVLLQGNMIQRIQTVYLLAATFAGLLMFIVPTAVVDERTGIGMYVYDSIGALIALIFASAFALIAVSLFKNRKLQMKISLLSAILFVLTFVAAFYDVVDFENKQFGLGLPLIAAFLVFIGRNAINKDEKLVRSADRLR